VDVDVVPANQHHIQTSDVNVASIFCKQTLVLQQTDCTGSNGESMHQCQHTENHVLTMVIVSSLVVQVKVSGRMCVFVCVFLIWTTTFEPDDL